MTLLAVAILPLLIVIAVFGLVVWLINTYIPMSAGIKRVVNIVAVVGLVLYLMQVFGVWGYLNAVKV